MLGNESGEKKFAALDDAPIASPEGQKLFAEGNRIRAKASTDAEFAAAKKQAFPPYLQAAELGHAESIGRIGSYYQSNDQGVERNMGGRASGR